MGDDAGQWVELRVHGVSGTPPESLLAHSHVAQVDGGESSRFFRPVDAANNEVPGSDGQVLEAYHWGKYTSGSWQQALWLTLVPFGMINAAQFMLPAAPTEPGMTWRSSLHAVAGALLRFLALLLTELMIFAAGLTLIDEVAWRWAPHSERLASWSTTLVFSLAVVGTAGVAVVLYALGRGFAKDSKDEPDIASGSGEMPNKYDANLDRQSTGTPLANVAFYGGSADAPTLRRLHLAAGILLAAMMGRLARDADAWPHHDATLLATLAFLVAVVLAVTVLGDPEGSASAVYARRAASMRLQWHAFMKKASWFAIAAGVLCLFFAVRQLDGIAPLKPGLPDRIESYDTVANVILFSGFSALILLLASCACLIPVSRSTRLEKGSPAWHFRPYASGMTSALVACLAVFVGVGLSAAVATAVSSALGLSVKDKAYATGETVRVGVTPMLDRVAYAWGLTFFLLLAMMVVFAFRFGVAFRPLARRADAMFAFAAPVDPNRYARSWSKRRVLAMWIARLKNHVPGIVWTFVVAGLALSFAIVAELGLLGSDFAARWSGTLFDKLSQPLAVPPIGAAGDSANVIANLGVWLLLSAGAGLILLARLGLREESSRRGINVIWDVISFWPHAVHPFVPRPYSQSAVPDLKRRIGQHLQTRDAGDRAVVVCGHSQGSLISFAAVSLLDDQDKARVALLTFGSQLRLMFSRAFPAYMNFEAISRLHGDLGGAWLNLYRDTDPLAGPVLSWGHLGEGTQARSQHFPDPFAGPENDEYVTPARVRRSGHDWRLLDPAPRVAPGQTGPVNLLYKHSNYWLDPAWRDALMILHRS